MNDRDMIINLAKALSRLDRTTRERFKQMETKHLQNNCKCVTKPIQLQPIKPQPERIDVMVDLETLGTENDAFIFQIAATVFDIFTGDIIKTFDKVVDLNKETQGTIYTNTLNWWATNHGELFNVLLKRGSVSSKELATEFHEWLSNLDTEEKNVYLWGNGIMFDNNFINEFFKSNELNYPIHYQNDRDVRTIFELAQIKTGKTRHELRDEIYDGSLIAHDALNDCINQSKLVAACFRILIEDESERGATYHVGG